MSLTPEGETHLESVLKLVYAAVGAIARADASDGRRVWEELSLEAKVNFVYAERGEAYSEAAGWVRRLGTYGGRRVLTGGRVLDGGAFPHAQLAALLETYVVPRNGMVVRESRQFKDGLAGALDEDDDDEADGVSVGAPATAPQPAAGAARRSEALLSTELASFDELFLEKYYKVQSPPSSDDLPRSLPPISR